MAMTSTTNPATEREQARRVTLDPYLGAPTGEDHPGPDPAGAGPEPSPEAPPREALFSGDELAGYAAFFTSIGVPGAAVEKYQRDFLTQSKPLLATLGVEDAQLEMGISKDAGAAALPAWVRLGAALLGLGYVTVSCRAAHGAPIRRRPADPEPAEAEPEGDADAEAATDWAMDADV